MAAGGFELCTSCCAPRAGMISYPNSRRLTTMWYESSVISILTPSPSTGHISALRYRPLEILGALQSFQWVLFSDWIHGHSFILIRSCAQVFLPSLRSSHSYNMQCLQVCWEKSQIACFILLFFCLQVGCSWPNSSTAFRLIQPYPALILGWWPNE